MKQYLGGIEIISIGEPFKSFGYRGRFVPYEIKLKNPAKRWIVDGGI